MRKARKVSPSFILHHSSLFSLKLLRLCFFGLSLLLVVEFLASKREPLAEDFAARLDRAGREVAPARAFADEV